MAKKSRGVKRKTSEKLKEKKKKPLAKRKKKIVPVKSKKTNLRSIEKKLNQVLSNQEKIERLERKQLREEEESQRLERKQLREGEETQDLERTQLKELRELEDEIQKSVIRHPLRKITIRDFSRGLIGAFVGIVSHFAFIDGAHVAETISITRATGLLILSFFIGFTFIYFTGYRKIRDKKLLSFLPVRVIVIYFVSLFAIFIVLFAFGVIDPTTSLEFGLIYRQVAVISLPAIIGAAAADLIGKNE